ncbi:MAG: head-tail joining protein [Dichotomicrobium sp.]
MDDVDKDIIEALAEEGMGAYTDAVYTPPDGGDPVLDVYVIVEDLVDETTGQVTQGGAVLSLLKSQVDVATQGGTVEAGDTTWTITRRRATTDKSLIQYEAKR